MGRPLKEAYFRNDTINTVSESIMEELAESVRIRNLPFSKANSALIVLDMQDFFLKEDSRAFIPSAPAIIPRINSLISAFETENRPAFFTRHINNPQNAGSMARWWRELIDIKNPRSEITEQLSTTGHDVVIKSQYDAFQDTDLYERLKKENAEQVVIAGIMTHLCCETTARSAFMRGFDVFFAVDGTADYNENFHRASLLNLAHGFTVPVLAKDIIKSMGDDEI